MDVFKLRGRTNRGLAAMLHKLQSYEVWKLHYGGNEVSSGTV
jgi:hypothetical protein